MFEDDGTILRLTRLLRLRDTIIETIQYGLKEADRTADLDLVRELELKVEECALVSREIAEIMNENNPPAEPTHRK
jgi:ribosome maturation factor RimP